MGVCQHKKAYLSVFDAALQWILQRNFSFGQKDDSNVLFFADNEYMDI